jgi:hypothetical protein
MLFFLYVIQGMMQSYLCCWYISVQVQWDRCHDAELAVLLICLGLSSMRYMGLKKPAQIHIWDKNDLHRYLCTTCSLQHLASTLVHPGFSMGSMLLIFLVFRIVYFFCFACLSTMYLFGKYIFTLFYSIIINIYSNDWVIHLY